jgi:cell division transport system ATP-binding protein
MIEFEHVSKVYPDTQIQALEDITLTIDDGEFVSFIGHSGAGKSTLVKLFLGEERPSDGVLYYKGEDVHRFRHQQMNEYRRNIGIVFQDFRLLSGRTVYENVAFAMEVAGKSDEDIADDVPYVLELVDLSDKAYSFPHQLSGGEKQRLAIARAIVNEPELLIADEPTGNLDPVSTFEIVEILKKINELGTTVILTTHNTGVVDTLKKRVITLEKGRVVQDDKHGSYKLSKK